MKIACIIDSIKTFGGTQIQCIRVAEYLAKLGHEVEIYTTALDLQYSHNIENIVRLNIFEITSKQRMEEFADKIHNQTQGCDWLLVFDWTVHRLKYYLPNKKICWICNDPPYSRKYFGKFRIVALLKYWILTIYGRHREHRYIKRLDCIMVLDNKNKEFLKEHYGVESHVVRSGIDITSTTTQGMDDAHFDKLAIKYHIEKKKYILAIGIAFRYRNYEVLIKSLEFIDNQINAVIIAPGYYDKGYAAELKSLIQNKSRIFLEEHFISEIEKDLLLKNALCLVFPNKNQTWGLAPLESLMHNTIPIISRECGVTEVLEDRIHALHFDPDSPTDLANRINFVIKNNGPCPKIIEIGRTFILENLTWDRYAEEIVHILNGSKLL